MSGVPGLLDRFMLCLQPGGKPCKKRKSTASATHTDLYCLSISPVACKKMRSIFVYKGALRHVDFGHIDYDDFTQHKDEKRKLNYLSRSAGILNKQGALTKDDPLSPNYWARRILWDSGESFSAIQQ